MNVARVLLSLTTASLATLIAGCVPSTEEPEPRGAGGFRTEPSAAARGEPFVTSDGWTVRFERFAASAYVSAYPDSIQGSGGSLGHVWNGREPVELYAPGVSLGRAEVSLGLTSLTDYDDGRFQSDVRQVGLDDALVKRFSERADDRKLGPYSGYGNPTVVVTFVGQKGDRVVRVDLGLAGLGYASAQATVEVHKNALSAVPLPLTPERLLSSYNIELNLQGGTTGVDDAKRLEELVFRPFADADRAGDDDGIVSTEELDSYSVVVADDPSSPFGNRTERLLEVVSKRVVLLFGSASVVPPNGPPTGPDEYY